MAATILETIAAYAKERAAKDKENVPEVVMKELGTGTSERHIQIQSSTEKERNGFYM